MKTHEVKTYGRWMFLVSSASRKGLYHLVDLEAETDDEGKPLPGGRDYRCSCEADAFAVERPCRHVRAVVSHLKPVFEVLSKLASSFETIPPKTQPKKRTYILNTEKKLK